MAHSADAANGDRDFVAIAEQYCEDVRRGKIVACKLIKAAVRRQVKDRKKKRWPFEFDKWHATDVCLFLEGLPHIEGSWPSPTIVLEPWQIFVWTTVFGWRRKEDGTRRFSDVYLEVARKNAKSAIASGIALYCLTCEGEVGPQVKIAATTGDQARIVFDAAKKMAQAGEGFVDEFGIECYARSIVSGLNGGSMSPINAKASTQDGLNPHLTVLDELHAHKDRALYDVLRSARGARRNPMQLVITTAGYNLEGVCYEQRKFAITVLKGLVVADHVFAAIYTIDDKDDELDPKCWPKANPNLDVSVFRRDLEAYAATARVSPDSLQEFKTKRCNVWSGSRAPWLNLQKWNRCAGKFDADDLAGMMCWGGVDLASTSDIAAFALVFPFEERVRLLCRMYVPEEAVKPRSERGNVPYQRWVKDGWLVATPGDITDYDYIEADIREALDRYDVQGISFDPWNAYHLVNKLTEDGAPMVEFRQGPKSYAPAMTEFERSVVGGILEHDGNPVLAWMANNLVVRRDVNENMAPDRKNSEDKIDGLVATIMAMGGMATFDNAASVYEGRGLRSIA